MDAVSTLANSSVPQSPQSSSQAAIGEEFNSFLKLLTAQVKNQDPLSPLESTQFVEQLATFSALEQQVQANASLDNIALIMNDLHSVVASEWLGQTVSVESSWVPYSGEDVVFNFDAPEDADRAVLTIRDNAGAVTWSDNLNMTDAEHIWTGETLNGTNVSPGTNHQVSIDFYKDGRFTGSVAPRLVTTVTNVGSENGKLRVGTAMNVSADLTAVRKVDE